MADSKKLKPTKKMLEFRKNLVKKQNEHNEKIQEFNQKVAAAKLPINKRISKLRKDQSLAVEAAIGYGLAMKITEESIRDSQLELDEMVAELEKDRPPYKNTYNDFQAEFGIQDHEVDWSQAEISE